MSIERALHEQNYWNLHIFPIVEEVVTSQALPEYIDFMRSRVNHGMSFPLATAGAVAQDSEDIESLIYELNPDKAFGVDISGSLNYAVKYLMFTDQMHANSGLMSSLRHVLSTRTDEREIIERDLEKLKYKVDLASNLFRQDPTGFVLLDYLLDDPKEIKERKQREFPYFSITDKLSRYGVLNYKKYYIAGQAAGIPWQNNRGN